MSPIGDATTSVDITCYERVDLLGVDIVCHVDRQSVTAFVPYVGHFGNLVTCQQTVKSGTPTTESCTSPYAAPVAL